MKKILLIAILFIGFMGIQNAQNARLDTLFREYSSDEPEYSKFFTYVYSASEKEKNEPNPNSNTSKIIKVKTCNYMLICNKKAPQSTKDDFLYSVRSILEKEKFELLSKNKVSNDTQVERYTYSGDNEKGSLTIMKVSGDIRVMWEWEVPLKK